MATVMYIPEHRQNRFAMRAVINYCQQEYKTYDNKSKRQLISGVNCDGGNSFREFMAMKKIHGKDNGFFFYHYAQSFSPKEKITPEQAHEVALEFAEKAWAGHEVLVTTHCDAAHIHSHFVINSVGFESGMKLRQSPSTLKQLRKLSDEICIAHGLSVLQPYQGGRNSVSSREYRVWLKGNSWKDELSKDVDKALYCRLSKDDLNVGDSDSIVHQRAILEKYAEDNCFPNIRVFVDDGYSGVSFDRPGFQEMYKLIEAGKVGIVITKDLSRLGRNYIEVGNYTEFVFPRCGVRYIAINDNYDSLFSDNNELAPFKNLFNEWYARDTSKKIRAVIKAKAERGQRLGTTIPYGYRRDPESGKECHLLINEETAPVVRMIYSMCASGIGPCNIAKSLQEKKILKPTFYRFQKEGRYGTHTDTDNPYKWNERTIADILDNEIYIGNTINCQTRIASFKDKRTIKVPKEEQLRFENTHEAIIDQETWDIVRKVREGRIRKTRLGEINKYSGLIYCADCGRKHYFCRGRTVKRENYSFICGNYHKHVGEEKCTPHSIREVVLDEIVLEEINRALYYARNNTKEFTDYISKKTSSQYRKELNAKTAELSKAEKRIIELKSLFKRLYEDNVLGRISDEQYRMLSLDYNDEQKELEQSIPDLQKEIDTLKNECTNVQKFLDIVRKYVHVEELTPEILRTFISKIVVHEREKKHSHTSPQQIDIYFRYIGTFALPSITDITEETKQDKRRTA